MDQTEVSNLLLDTGAVTVNSKQPFRYTSGLLSPIYCDNRLILSSIINRDKVIDAFSDLVGEKIDSFHGIAGVATAGIAWAAILAAILKKPLMYVRPAAKKHGRQNQIEGKMKEGSRVLVVEDLVSTGKSTLNAVAALRQAGYKVTDVICIFTYGTSESIKNFKKEKITLLPLTDLSNLLQAADQGKSIKNVELILDWAKDPGSWETKWKATQ